MADESSYKRIAIVSVAVSILSIVALIIVVFSPPETVTNSSGQPEIIPFGGGPSYGVIQTVSTSATTASTTTTGESSGISGTSGKLFEGKKVAQFTRQRLFGGVQTLSQLEKVYGTNGMGNKAHLSVPGVEEITCDKWSVVTTISPPTGAVERQAQLDEWCIVVVGDKKGPFEYPIPNVEHGKKFIFLTAEKQEKLAEIYPLIKLLPWNHFGRKNIGYLYAIAHGARVIYDFDDDNALISKHHGFQLPGSTYIGGPSSSSIKGSYLATNATSNPSETSNPTIQVEVPFNYTSIVLNPYPLLGANVNPAWPRGYPLDLIKSTYASSNNAGGGFVVNKQMIAMPLEQVGVIQYLANHDPDVDAIYRLIQPLPLDFPLRGFSPLVLPLKTTPISPNIESTRVYTPYNAQATLHLYSALWTLLLPVTVHGRVSDIWRSYFAQRLMSDLSQPLRLIFHPPVVVQYRNDHNYLADFDSEGPLYKESLKLVQQLDTWASCLPSLPGRIEELWIMLYEHGYIAERDVLLLQAWLQSLLLVGYKFPAVGKVGVDCHAHTIDRKMKKRTLRM